MGKSRRAGLLAAVFGAGLIAFGASTAAQAETLAEAIALAYSTNPTLLRQRSELRQADERYYRTSRGIGPTVSADIVLNPSATRDLDDGFQGARSGSVTGSINAQQSIYSGGRLTAQLAQEEASLLASREALRQTEMQVIQNVVEAYTAVRRAEQQLEISRENVAVLVRQREEAQARFEVGQQTRTDLAQAESRLAQSRTQLTQAQNTLDNARVSYATIVGRMPETLQPEPSLAPALPASQALAFQVAEVNNPSLRQAYLQERQTAAGISAAKSARRPTVSFTTGITAAEPFGGTRDLLGRPVNDFDAGLTTSARISIPLYTGLTTSSTIRSAIETNRSSNIAIEGQRRTLNQQVTQAWNALIAARAQIASQEEAVRASNLAVEGVREELSVGLRVTIDLLNEEQNLRQAELALVNARFNEYVAQVQLLNAMGQLSPELFGAQVEKYDPKRHFNEVNDFALPWEPLIMTIDRLGAAPIPERQPLPGENVPTFEPVR